MNLRRIRVACEHCLGSGRRTLTTIERDTLAAVWDEWMLTAAVLRQLPGVKLTALCNRLVKLRTIGLVERRENSSNGKLVEWRRIR